jgi:plastocyanin
MKTNVNLLPASALILAATLTLAGCKPDAASKASSSVDKSSIPASTSVITNTATQASVDPTTLGSVQGTVAFTGKPPARVKIDTTLDPACSIGAGSNLSEQYIIASGKVANVYVYIKTGATPSKAPAGTPAVVLDQKGCQYTPHVIAVQQGGTVEFHNSDSTMHNIHTMPMSGSANPPTDISQGPHGQVHTQQFNDPEVMMPVRCNNHPWMNAFLNIAPNPYFAVTGADGKFEIKGLPAGTYTLAAVHEKLGEQDIQITVAPKQTAKAGFTFTAK